MTWLFINAVENKICFCFNWKVQDISSFCAPKYKYGAFSLLSQIHNQQMNRAYLLIPVGNLKAAGHNLIKDNDNQSNWAHQFELGCFT